MSNKGQLYIVATPIGNLGDITQRAIAVLNAVAVIAAEDTRQSKKLLAHYGINTSLTSVHAHNERVAATKIVNRLINGEDVAYITDAGTPLMSDPGAVLVQIARENGIQVIPVPGPCAAIAALSVAGLNKPQFYFEGFLPAKSSSRKMRIKELEDYCCTLVFYESPHRILAMLTELAEILGNRHAVLARELTKKFETIIAGSIDDLVERLVQDPEQQLGEFVVMVSGRETDEALPIEKIITTLELLLPQLPLKQSVALTSKLLDVGKNEVYDIALKLKQSR